jgi:hypothetical protein
MPKILVTLIAFIALAFSFRQGHTSKSSYFISPLQGSLKLSGTFGELRPQHFHAGIDMKAPVGTSVRASAEGYISKISVSAGGYGNVLYLQHPNGYTSIYAHLQSFHPAIAAYVKKSQYQNKSFEIVLNPPKDSFIFQQGEVIGKLGVSGRSFGPHLHFEIRHTDSGVAINPLSFNIYASDTRQPKIKTLQSYAFDEEGNTLQRVAQPVRKKGKYYIPTQGDTLLVAGHHAGFAVEALDQLNGAYNWNGVYEILLYQDDNLRFHTQMEHLPLKQLRFLNAHIDYPVWKQSGAFLNRCFLLPFNELEDIYPRKDGFLYVGQGQKSAINIIVKDRAGNSSNLRFWIKSTSDTLTRYQPFYNYPLNASVPNGINEPGLQLLFPEKTFYEDIALHYAASYEDSYNVYSLVHEIHDHHTPLHYPFELAIQPNQPISTTLKDKAFIAYCGHDGTTTNVGGQWKGDWLYTRSRQLGQYYVAIDTTAPEIVPLSFRQKRKNPYLISFKIQDNFTSAGHAQGIKYEGWIDEKWVLFSYDAKAKTIQHHFEKTLPPGPHHLELRVEDAVGNVSLFESEFMK